MTEWVNSRAKRWMDVALVAPTAVVLLPLMAVVAICVRVRLGPPVLFRQIRPGRDAAPFMLYKFRSMRTDERDEPGSVLGDAERTPPFGAFLRNWSLDELPELWNILRGDMSLVGPRPLLMEYVGLYTPEHRRRLDTRPGLTGWQQINGRRTTDWEVRHCQDVWYVDHASLWLDLKIILLTVVKVLRREGVAFRDGAKPREFEG
jgi:sugar transferase EpsL